MMKKVTAVVVAVLMIASLIPVIIVAEEATDTEVLTLSLAEPEAIEEQYAAPVEGSERKEDGKTEADKIEVIAEEPAKEEPVEEQSVNEEPVDEVTLETVIEEIADGASEEGIIEEVTEEPDKTEEEAVEELDEDEPVEEPAEEVVEDEPTEEVFEDDAEEVTEEPAEEVTEEPAEEVIEEDPSEEIPAEIEGDLEKTPELAAAFTPERQEAELQARIAAALAPDRTIGIRMVYEDEAHAVGTKVDMICDLKGYEQVVCNVQWQVQKEKDGKWTDIPGAAGTVFTLEITEDAFDWNWRVKITPVDVIDA